MSITEAIVDLRRPRCFLQFYDQLHHKSRDPRLDRHRALYILTRLSELSSSPHRCYPLCTMSWFFRKEASRKYVDLINETSSKWANWDPPAPIVVSAPIAMIKIKQPQMLVLLHRLVILARSAARLVNLSGKATSTRSQRQLPLRNSIKLNGARQKRS